MHRSATQRHQRSRIISAFSWISARAYAVITQYKRRISVTLFFLLSHCLCSCGGGGKSDPVRYAVSGVVTFNGKPVPAGEIVFEPDGSKGNQGPSATTLIRQGKYAFNSRDGVVGGPSIVRIVGLDGVPPNGPEAKMAPHGMQMFVPYRTTLDLPKAASTQNIDVPTVR